MENRILSIVNLDKTIVEKEFKVIMDYGVIILEMISLDNEYIISCCDEDDEGDHWFIITDKNLIELYLKNKKSLRELVEAPSTLYAKNYFSDEYIVIDYAKNIKGIEELIPHADSFIGYDNE